MVSVFKKYSLCKCFALSFLGFAVSGGLFARPDFKYELENRIVQYIEWPAQEDTLYYELIIERDDDGAWTPALTQSTEETTLKTMLAAGKYRYRVDVWDLLGRRRPPAPWANLVILKALRPTLTTIQPDTIYLDEGGPWQLTVTGENIAENSVAFLSRPNGLRVEPDQWTVQRDGESAVLEFSSDGLEEGVYSVTVQNPGGMDASMPNFNVLFSNFSNSDGEAGDYAGDYTKIFFFAIGYNMLATVKGEFAQGEFGNYLHSKYYPIGAHLRFAWLPFQGNFGALGFEVRPSWNWMESESYDESNGHYRVHMHLGSFDFGVLYRSPVVFNRFVLIARGGGGMALGYRLEVLVEGKSSMQPFWGAVPFVQGALAFQFLLNRVFFIEVGAEFVMLFSESDSVYIRPTVSIGWNF
jgi:hypothetical protein